MRMMHLGVSTSIEESPPDSKSRACDSAWKADNMRCRHTCTENASWSMGLTACSTAIKSGVSRDCSRSWMTFDQCLMNSLAFLLVVNCIQPRRAMSALSLCRFWSTTVTTLKTTVSACRVMGMVGLVCWPALTAESGL